MIDEQRPLNGTIDHSQEQQHRQLAAVYHSTLPDWAIKAALRLAMLEPGIHELTFIVQGDGNRQLSIRGGAGKLEELGGAKKGNGRG